jgi:hypothetical protein
MKSSDYNFYFPVLNDNMRNCAKVESSLNVDVFVHLVYEYT